MMTVDQNLLPTIRQSNALTDILCWNSIWKLAERIRFVKGKNPSKGLWRIGINKPIDDSLAVNQDLQTILEITDLGLATSGNYRNYYYKDGKKYAHTIDPRTGYPVQHNILSSTVIAKDCMTADALATAFMVMGLEEAEAFCKADTTIDAYFIYSGENGEFKTYYTEGMKKYITTP